jgi:hypothetical protein
MRKNAGLECVYIHFLWWALWGFSVNKSSSLIYNSGVETALRVWLRESCGSQENMSDDTVGQFSCSWDA